MGATETLVTGLRDKDAVYAYSCLKQLRQLSAAGDEVYGFYGDFVEMLADRSAYVRVRGLLLLADNARWDRAGKLDAVLERYLLHITDDKPTAARQCIQALPTVAAAKPHLAGRICAALRAADWRQYADSMQPLIRRDIAAALQAIEQGPGSVSHG
ncbi:SufBD protein [Neobittarella massiliensis]|uniref:SufBD protein n=1 Tax=Neobittarella massiliensis (ex Bilen et al. 2018) TaxID=2041842 RepID=A0A8J6INQ6_9FIRM|nr:SufBD protein [Neobittarella massiliensis]MBC3516085.1 SufBD protein [Neobittarella massiliensis]